MPRLVVTCPECSAKLEAPSDYLGRDGQCPGCQRIFCIRPSEGHGWVVGDAAGHVLDQRDTGVLSIPFVMSGCLLLLVLATFVRWANPFGREMAFIGTAKLLMAAVSVACLLFLAASAATRACAAPAALLAGAWGVAATCWLFGLGRFLDRWARADGTFEPLTGLYTAFGAGLLLVAAAAYAYAQYRRTGLLRQPAGAFLSSGGMGLVIGVTVLLLHAAPASRRALAMARAGGVSVTPTVAQDSPSPVSPVPQTVGPAVPVAQPAPGQPAPTGSTPTEPAPAVVPVRPVVTLPPEAVLPEAPPDDGPVPTRWMWVEAEDAFQHNCVFPKTEAGIAWKAVSGGRWLAHYPHLRNVERPADAHCTFVAEDPSGYYSLWVRAYPMKDIASIQVQIDDRGNAKFTGRVGGTANARAGGQPAMMGWGFFGKHEIAGGEHSLTVHFPDWVRPSAVDCLVFTEFDWLPGGTEKPTPDRSYAAPR